MDILDYYNKNARNFAERTLTADMAESQNRFLKYLNKGDLILDFGCGAGRDSKFFLDQGYKVDSLDGSSKLVKIAQDYTGQPVILSTFEEFNTNKKYDGIWACASLVHLTLQDMLKTLQKLIKFLKEDGILYFSVRKGDFEGELNGRYFKYLSDNQLTYLLNQLENIKVLEIWTSKDSRVNQKNIWHNVILRKNG